MNTMNGYADPKMKLSDVCDWLSNKGYNILADIIKDKFTYHTWTKNGMTRKDIIEDIFERAFDGTTTFRALECDVITHMDVIPYGEAHVD